ncbi:MAG: prepilin-type N-terminal cleavage/methylation domain-containing protein [Gemmatimonadota bacterium]
MKRGYTLVEMLVVLAILGIMAGAAVPAVGVWLDRTPSPAEEVAALIRNARALALETGCPVTLTWDPQSGRWLIEAGDAAPVEGAVALRGATVMTPLRRVVVQFAPTGGADVGPVQVRWNDRLDVVRADRWTGKVTLDGE